MRPLSALLIRVGFAQDSSHVAYPSLSPLSHNVPASGSDEFTPLTLVARFQLIIL